jgi:hypothetical protein
MTVRFVVAILAILVPLVPGIVLLRHLDRRSEWKHLERMRALELGLPMPEHAGWPTHVWIGLVYIAIGALMPIGVLFIGWLDHMTVDASDRPVGLGFAAGIIGTAGAFYSTFWCAIAMFAARDRSKVPNRAGFFSGLLGSASAAFGFPKGSKGLGYHAAPGFEPDEHDFAGPYD